MPTLLHIERLRTMAATEIARLRHTPLPLVWIAVLLALFVAGDAVLTRVSHLPASSYARPIIAIEFGRRLVEFDPLGTVTLLALLGLLAVAIGARTLGPPWSLVQHGERLRTLCLVVAGTLAWAYASYDYNHYAAQGHLLDRLLIVLFLPMIYWRPAFLLPFLLVLLPTVWQFDQPVGGFSWSEPVLLVRVLVLIGAAYGIRVFTARLRGADVVFVLACLIAAHYWVSGYGKLELGWLSSGNIHYLLPATYANGWLGSLGPDTIAEWTNRLQPFDGFMRGATILLECGALFFLGGRRVMQFLLIGWIGLHFGIVLVSGIFFWKWMILDAAVLMLFRGRFLEESPIFTPTHFILSLLLIGTGAYWARPIKLAWYEVPVSYTYRVEAEGKAGARYPLPPHFFAPFDYQFTLGNFGYLLTEPRLPIVWGTTATRRVAEQLNLAQNARDVFALEKSRGRSQYRSDRKAVLESFLARFVPRKASAASDAASAWHLLQAPSQLWTFPRRIALPDGEELQRLRVYQVTSLFDGDRYREIRNRLVLSHELTAPSDPPPARNHTD